MVTSPSAMPEPGFVPFANKIAVDLHQSVKRYCVDHRIKMWEFIKQAIKEKLSREATVQASADPHENVRPIRRPSGS